MPQTIAIPEVDEVQVTSIVDNVVDMGTFSKNDENVVQRYLMKSGMFEGLMPMAEHGFSALLHVKQGDKTGTFLYDTGVTSQGTMHNIDALEINIKEIQAIVISHGHADHTMGLPGLMNRYQDQQVWPDRASGRTDENQHDHQVDAYIEGLSCDLTRRLFAARMQASITTSSPAVWATSAACSLTIPSCIQTTLAPI